MNKQLKIEILYFVIDIKSLFAKYKDIMQLDIKDINLKNKFGFFFRGANN